MAVLKRSIKRIIAALILSLYITMSLTVFAWYANQRVQVPYSYGTVEKPSILYIDGANKEDIIEIEVKNIRPGTNYYVVGISCVDLLSDPISAFVKKNRGYDIEIIHTQNIVQNISLYEAEYSATYVAGEGYQTIGGSGGYFYVTESTVNNSAGYYNFTDTSLNYTDNTEAGNHLAYDTEVGDGQTYDSIEDIVNTARYNLYQYSILNNSLCFTNEDQVDNELLNTNYDTSRIRYYVLEISVADTSFLTKDLDILYVVVNSTN